MLVIESYRQVEASVETVIDEYVPLTIRTSPGPLAVCYYTVGDRVTSLVEVKIEQVSRMVRGIALVSFHDAVTFHEPTDARVVEGLPIIAARSVPQFREHAEAPVTVGLSANAVCVDWSGGTSIDTMIRQDRVDFLVGQNELLGVLVRQLPSRDVAQLHQHAHRS